MPAKPSASFHKRAAFLREATGSTNVEKTLLKALKVLKRFDIPHLVCGGLTVQEHGYLRFTANVDIIVPDVRLAREKLRLNGFAGKRGSTTAVRNAGASVRFGIGTTKPKVTVEVRLLQGGSRIGPMLVPSPRMASSTPQLLTLAELISVKLSHYAANPARLQDFADAVELMKATRAPRHLGVNSAVRDVYRRIWLWLYANGDQPTQSAASTGSRSSGTLGSRTAGKGLSTE